MPPQDLGFCWRYSVFDEGMTVQCAANSAWVGSPCHETPAHHTCPSDFMVDTSWSEKERMTKIELVLDCWLSPSASWQKGAFGNLMDPLWGSWLSWCLCTTLDSGSAKSAALRAQSHSCFTVDTLSHMGTHWWHGVSPILCVVIRLTCRYTCVQFFREFWSWSKHMALSIVQRTAFSTSWTVSTWVASVYVCSSTSTVSLNLLLERNFVSPPPFLKTTTLFIACVEIRVALPG